MTASKSVDEAIHKMPYVAQREVAINALEVPDLYPARGVAEHLGVTTAAVHAWRREHGFRKARS